MNSQKSILLIEDDRATSAHLSTILKLSGHTVKCCFDGTGAVNLNGSSQFDVIISDYYVPGANGAHVIKALKHRYPSALIIGYSGRNMKTQFMEAGADAFLFKPFQMQELIDMIQSCRR
jgi:DNA-binding NtrC family response regulator